MNDNVLLRLAKRLRWKDSLTYLILMQLEVVVSSTFLIMGIIPLIRYIFEVGVVREIVEIITLLIIECTVRFLMSYSIFKNSRTLDFGQFCLNCAPALAVRFFLSLLTSFAAWTAGITISLIGTFLGKEFIDENIITMSQVPVWLYVIIFILFEALVIFLAFLSYKLSCRKREKIRKELYGNENR